MFYIAFTDGAEWVRPFVQRYLTEISDYTVWQPGVHQSIVPSVVFFSDGKKGEHRAFKESKKVFITCEDLYPDFSKADFIISCRHVKNERYLRMPYWALLHDPKLLIKSANYAAEVLEQQREFCAFVQSNHNPRRTRRRLDFFKALSHRRFVHSGGSTLNNIGYRVGDIHSFLSKFKLFICFENARSEGYTTEKIVNAMMNGCVPIYWGDPLIHLDFNKKSFVDATDFRSESDLLDHVERIADDENLRRAYLEEPVFLANQIPSIFERERILNFFRNILNEQKPRRKVFSLKAQLDKLKHRIKPYLSRY